MKAQKAYKLAKDDVKCCYLCGKEEIEVLGCFVPDDPAEWTPGKPAPGKTRTLWYGLCGECFKLPNKAELVEKKIASELN
ncbi:hypothetical protein ES708_27614 [subsurface metagenome]